MRRFDQFMLITLVRGVLFLFPIVLIAVVTREAYQPLGQGRPDRAEGMRSIRVMPRADSDRRFSGTPNALWAIPGPAIVALV